VKFCRFVCGRPVAVALILLLAGLVLLAGPPWGQLQQLVCPLFDSDCPEPLSFTSGISVWPSLYLEVLALVLSLCFSLLVHFRAEGSVRKIGADFFADQSRTEPTAQRHADCWLSHLFSHLRSFWNRSGDLVGFRSKLRITNTLRGGSRTDAEGIWLRYRKQTAIHWRFLRVLIVSLLFYLLTVLLYRVTGGGASSPVRGTEISGLYLELRMLSMFLIIVLVIGVLDATLSCRSFIRSIADTSIRWPKDILARISKEEGLHAGYLSPWISLSVIGEHADTIVRLVVYPLIVLVILIGARLPWFDTITLPTNVVIAFVVIAFYIFLSAWSVQRAAGYAKQRVHEHYLRCRDRSRNGSMPDEHASAQLDLLATKVAELSHGAFRPIAQQPLVRIAVLPFGALGLGLLEMLS